MPWIRGDRRRVVHAWIDGNVLVVQILRDPGALVSGVVTRAKQGMEYR